MDADAALNAFLRRIAEDCRTPTGPKPLEIYLAQWPEHRVTIEQAYADVVSDAMAPEEPSPTESGAGSVGPYQLLRLLGQGGQGQVYLAKDPRLGRTVALKVLTGLARASPHALERFRREAVLASRLEHPAICRVYEAGVAQGTAFIAMQYVAGQTLDRQIAQSRGASPSTRLPSTHVDLTRSSATPAAPSPQPSVSSTGTSTVEEVRSAMATFVTIARALHVAHEAGVLHRDIKPANIMVSEEGAPVILDFGLAAAEEIDGPTLTATGDLFGTPAYMSPEQIGAGRTTLDRRTDVYSLGVTLFEVVTGRRPFEAPSRELLYREILTTETPDPRRFNPRLPRDLSVVIAMATEKTPDRRYVTAAALADDLERVLNFEPIAARPVGPMERIWRWSQRHPGVAVLTGLLALLFAIATPTLWVLYRAAESEKTRAESQTSAAESARSEADRLQQRSEAEVVSLLTKRATALLDSGDWAQGLAVEAAAWRRRQELAGRDAAKLEEADRLHGTRAQSVLDRAARIGWRRQVPAGVVRLWVPPAGDQVAILGDQHLATFDLESGTALPAIFPKSRWGLSVREDLSSAARFLDDRVEVWPAGASAAAVRSEKSDRSFRRLILSPDGGWVAAAPHVVAAEDRSAFRLYDAGTGELKLRDRALGADRRGISFLAFSPDSSRLAAASVSGILEIWIPREGRAVGPRLTESSAFRDGVFSADSSRFLVGTDEGLVLLIDSATNAVLTRGAHHGAAIRALALAPDGRRWLSGAADGTVVMGDSASGKPVIPRIDHAGPVDHVQFSPDGLRFLTGSSSGEITIRSVVDGEIQGPILHHGGSLAAVSFDRLGRRIVAATAAGMVTMWDLAPAVDSITIDTGPASLNDVAFLPVTGRIATASQDGRVRIFDPATGETAGPTFWHLASVSTISTDPSESTLVTVSDREHRSFRIETGSAEGRPFGRTLGGETGVERAQHLSDHRTALLFEGHINVFDPRRLQITHQAFHVRRDLVAFSADGRFGAFSATGEENEFVFIHDFDVGSEILKVRSGSGVRALAFSNDGQNLATLGGRGLVIFDVASGREMVAPAAPGVSLAWSLDGERLALATEEGSVRLYESGSGKALDAVFELRGAPLLVSFGADRHSIVGVTRDGAIQFFDANSGESLGLRRHHGASVRKAAVNERRTLLAVAGADGIARVVPFPRGTELSVDQVAQAARWLSAQATDRDGTSVPDHLDISEGEREKLARVLAPLTQPAVASTHRQWARSSARADRPAGHLAHAEAAYLCMPESVTARLEFATALVANARASEALKVLETVPGVEAAGLLLRALVEQRDWERARDRLSHAGFRPEVEGLALGALFLSEGRTEEACQSARQSLRAYCRQTTVQAMVDLERDPARVAPIRAEFRILGFLFENKASSEESSPEQRLLRGLLATISSEGETAESQLAPLARQFPCEVALARGLMAARDVRRETAVSNLELALAADPALGEAWWLLAVMQQRLGQDRDSIESLETALELGCEEAGVWALRAFYHARMSEGDLAVKRHELAKSRDHDLANQLGIPTLDPLIRREQWPAAKHLVASLRDERPLFLSVVQRYLGVALKTGDSVEARQAASAFLGQGPLLFGQPLLDGALLAFLFEPPLPEAEPWVDRVRRNSSASSRQAFPVDAAWEWAYGDRAAGLAALEAAASATPTAWNLLLLARAQIQSGQTESAARSVAKAKSLRNRAQEPGSTSLLLDALEVIVRPTR